MGDGKVIDSMIQDGLQCAVNNYHMGITAENIAEQWGLTRGGKINSLHGVNKKPKMLFKKANSKPKLYPLSFHNAREIQSYLIEMNFHVQV